jgi:tetratricopeptide (TPR) repeat protein
MPGAFAKSFASLLSHLPDPLMTSLADHSLHAQTGPAISPLGNELLRQGKFEEAFEIFERMLRENPRSFAIYDRAVTALINLKRYDDAVEMTKQRLNRVGDDSNTQIKLGEIYDISGNVSRPMETWNQVLRRTCRKCAGVPARCRNHEPAPAFPRGHFCL